MDHNAVSSLCGSGGSNRHSGEYGEKDPLVLVSAFVKLSDNRSALAAQWGSEYLPERNENHTHTVDEFMRRTNSIICNLKARHGIVDWD